MSAPGPDDYTLAENLQSVLANTMKSPHWNTASDGLVGGRPTLAAALAVPEVAAMWHALLVWDQAHRTGRNEPLQVAFETGQSALDAIRAADPVTKPG